MNQTSATKDLFLSSIQKIYKAFVLIRFAINPCALMNDSCSSLLHVNWADYDKGSGTGKNNAGTPTKKNCYKGINCTTRIPVY